jgi:hypothetical protein
MEWVKNKPYGEELYTLLPTLRLDRKYGTACTHLQLSRCQFNRIEQADMLGERCLFIHPLTRTGSKRMKVSIPRLQNGDG